MSSVSIFVNFQCQLHVIQHEDESLDFQASARAKLCKLDGTLKSKYSRGFLYQILYTKSLQGNQVFYDLKEGFAMLQALNLASSDDLLNSKGPRFFHKPAYDL